MLLEATRVLLFLLGVWLALVAGYLLLLTVAALWGKRQRPPAGAARHRFAILIPAHDEEALIERLLASLARLDYPTDRYHVFVVADNCTDRTAALARAAGASVLERHDRTQQGKGFALRMLIEHLRVAGHHHDAYVVLDADTVVEHNLLRAFDARLASGAQVLQAHYAVLNESASSATALRAAALAAVHYLRPLGRAALGMSCGLKGNGMCFAAPVIDRFGWNWYTLAEDVEFHLALVRAGQQVDFVPETKVSADMPTSLHEAQSQNTRWERGRLQLVRHHVPALVGQGLRQRRGVALDAAIEQLIPPLSVPIAAGALVLGASLLAGAWPAALLAGASLAALAAYVLAALALVGAPASIYRALLAAPGYVLWKVLLYARAGLSTQSARWIRTARPAPSPPRPSVKLAGARKSNTP